MDCLIVDVNRAKCYNMREGDLRNIGYAGIFFALVFVAILAAGVFGALHDQISYSVSPEYYTRFKFLKFGLTDSALPERVRASVVGIFGSWWMGIPVGLMLAPIGFIGGDGKVCVRAVLRAYGIAMAFTLLCGLTGLCYGWFSTSSIDLSDYHSRFIPDNLVDLRRFLCVGYMHHASYAGALYSIPVAWIHYLLASRRSPTRTRQDLTA